MEAIADMNNTAKPQMCITLKPPQSFMRITNSRLPNTYLST
jgi:hypothetical protein